MNREEYLTQAMNLMAPLLEEHMPGCTDAIENWRVTCGFPGGGSARTRIGECWDAGASEGGTTEMFISPKLATQEDVDHVLLHEMIHAAVGNKHGHRGPFRTLAVAVGLEGKMTATTCGEALRERLNDILAPLGDYPHSTLNMAGRKKQTTRMVKLECKGCGYILRTSRKWIEVGIPTCCCGHDRWYLG